jgi:hypothetical protein
VDACQLLRARLPTFETLGSRPETTDSGYGGVLRPRPDLRVSLWSHSVATPTAVTLEARAPSNMCCASDVRYGSVATAPLTRWCDGDSSSAPAPLRKVVSGHSKSRGEGRQVIRLERLCVAFRVSEDRAGFRRHSAAHKVVRR